MADTSFYVLIGGTLILLLFISGVISGSEVAFFSFSRQEIDDMSSSSNKKENKIASLLNLPNRLLATILIINNLVNIFIVTISTYATWRIVGNEGLTIVILSAIVTICLIFFGEIIPKVYASNHKMKFANFSYRLLSISFKLCKPFAWILISSTRFIKKRIMNRTMNLTAEEINKALEISVNKNEITEDERGILKNIVTFGTLTVKQVMRSRMEINAFETEMNFHELMNLINKNGFSRIPIYTENIDKIEGILYVKDLLPHIDEESDFRWQTLLRPPFFVPESKKIDDLLKDFQEKQIHIALVIDEYGGTAGLITMEDIIEEIVGEINDEFDENEKAGYTKLDENNYLFEAKTSINDFSKILKIDPFIFDDIKGESESLGGLILEINTKFPNTGEIIKFENYSFIVVAVDNRRIKKIKVSIEPIVAENGQN